MGHTHVRAYLAEKLFCADQDTFNVWKQSKFWGLLLKFFIRWKEHEKLSWTILNEFQTLKSLFRKTWFLYFSFLNGCCYTWDTWVKSKGPWLTSPFLCTTCPRPGKPENRIRQRADLIYLDMINELTYWLIRIMSRVVTSLSGW